jgi:hypothetical protein
MMLLYIIILLLIFTFTYCNCYCDPKNSDTIPTNNGINNLVKYGTYASSCSEVINTYTQGSGSNVQWPRINCPHLQDGLTNFEDVFPTVDSESDITITDGMKLLLTSCSINNANNIIINRIIIKSGGTLIFNDNDIVLNVREIHIEADGKLYIGLETCRLYSTITINFHGSSASSSKVAFDNLPSKGIESLGIYYLLYIYIFIININL